MLAIAGLVEACQSAVERQEKLHIGVTGAATNIALFLAIHPDLAKQAVEQIVLMAGGVGIGNSTYTLSIVDCSDFDVHLLSYAYCR